MTLRGYVVGWLLAVLLVGSWAGVWVLFAAAESVLR